MNKYVAVALVGGLCLGAAPAVVEGAPVTGKFTITGMEDVRVGSDRIDFGVFPDIWGTPIGGIEFLTGTETFVGIGGTEGTVKDLIALPVDTPIMVPDFIEAFAFPGLDFTLTRLIGGVGTFPPCLPPSKAGDLCTVPGSPLTLLATSRRSFSVSLRLLGYVTNELGEVSLFTGDFTSQLTNLSIEQALATLDDETPYVQSSWSAEFAFEPREDVPEPASMVLMGLALTGMAVVRRRQRQ